MDKRPPTLPDLLPQDASLPMVQIPTYPQAWTQPATIDLLRAADNWPIKVAFAPYVGCAMVANTTATTRKALVRVSGSATFVRVDITQCCTSDSGADGQVSQVTLTGDEDAVAVRLWLSYFSYTAWPTDYATTIPARGTTSGAIIASPGANQDRQIEIAEGKAPQTESITVNHNHAITIWAGNRVGDLLTL